jgi:hypothetical protein
MISVGIPCGVAMVSMPAEDLPTINGMPAAPQMAPGVSGVGTSRQQQQLLLLGAEIVHADVTAINLHGLYCSA